MRVTIAGGHGKIARRLARLLSERGDEVVALIRNPDHAADVRSDGAEPVVVDLEHDDASKVAEAATGSDAVVFAAGAGPGSGAARKETMDYGGAVKLIEAAQAAGGLFYVMVSSMGADPAAREGGMAPYFRAKGKADEALRASGLPYTIVRPASLTDDPATGRVALGEGLDGGWIPRDDVAAVLAEVLQRSGPVGVTFDLVSGELAIGDALDSLGA
jgi:uncharacterized protein YbjT (DUF2867 family)